MLFWKSILKLSLTFVLTKLSKVCTKASQALEAKTEIGESLTTFGSRIAILGKLLFTLIPIFTLEISSMKLAL